MCNDDEAISVACQDLHYHVTIHEHVQGRMQESKEVYTAVALSELQDESGSRDSDSTFDLEEGIYLLCISNWVRIEQFMHAHCSNVGPDDDGELEHDELVSYLLDISLIL